MISSTVERREESETGASLSLLWTILGGTERATSALEVPMLEQ